MTTGRGGSASLAPLLRDAPDLRAEKAEFRRLARARRAAYARDHGVGAAERLDRHLAAAVAFPDHATVSGYVPIDDEMDIAPVMARYHRGGHAVCVPVIQGRGLPLLFRDWHPGTALIEGTYRVPVPPPEAPERVPDLLLVPLLGFDRHGYRMGYGAGFYDRTLETLRAQRTVLAVGVGFAGLEVDRLPVGPTDQRMDWIVTDREAIRIGRD
jgi:5-formyltetrahydrofolate cyclo-ligase